MTTRSKRIFSWVLFLAIVGAWLESARAILEIKHIIKGIVVGGAVGYVIAAFVNFIYERKR